MSNVKETLESRGSSHGNFEEQSETTINLIKAMQGTLLWQRIVVALIVW